MNTPRRQALLAALAVPAIPLLGGCAATGATASSSADDARAVAQAVEQLRALMLKPDAAGLNALLHERLSYGHSAGKVDTKASLTQALLDGSSAFASITLSAQTVDIVGNVANVRHVFDSDTVPKGRPAVRVHLQVLSVWLRGEGAGNRGWQLLARQAVTLPA